MGGKYKMKIIAFWSNVHGQSKTTSNMIALASSIALEENYSSILTQTHFDLNKLDAYLIGSREYSQEVFIDVGIDGLVRSMKLATLDKDVIHNYSIPLIKNKLSLLPGTTSDNRDIYMESMKQSIRKMLGEMNKHYDFVFVDLNSGLDEISKLVIEQADIVVVNLCQNRAVLDDYFQNKCINKKDMLYFFGSYDKNSSYNIRNLKLMYRQLKKSSTCVIPYCTGYMDAESKGLAINFIKENIDNPSENNRYFIDNLKLASQKLIKLASRGKVAPHGS